MTTRPSHLGMHHLALNVPDMDQARYFYVTLLGFEVEWEPDADNLYLTSGKDNLALHLGEVDDTTQRLDHLGILVETAEHVTQWETYLTEHGVEIAQATRTHRDGATSCYVRDSCGNLVQFIHHPPISPVLAR